MDYALGLMGGLGLFLYGMSLMGDGLQKAAGSKLKKIIGALTKNTFMGILVGTVVTMIIQSSSATTVMVVGFVNAGLMNLYQAVGIIFGANIGTTITGQMLALNISRYAPIAIFVGVLLFMLGKKKRIKSYAEIILGIGILFFGMAAMGEAMRPLGESAVYANLMAKLTNPWLGMLVGIVMTTILQSSSAAQAIILALASQNIINMHIAFPILFGQNIGTTTTALISSIGASRTAKQAAFIHFIFNVFGSLLFMLLLKNPIEAYVVNNFSQTTTQIAMAHTFFNVINVLWMMPFAKVLVKLAQKLIPEGDDKADKHAIHLDYRILTTPALAIETVMDELTRMNDLVLQNIDDSRDLLINKKSELMDVIYDREELINSLQKEIIDYLVKVSTSGLSKEQHETVDDLFFIVNDIERAGDHVKNITQLSEEKTNMDIHFTQEGKNELNEIYDLTYKVFTMTMDAYRSMSEEKAYDIVNTEKEIDICEKAFREKHFRRLMTNECEEEQGIIFLDTISNLERIGDHADNIAGYILKHFE